jgi:hypothetical protein
LPAAGLQCHTGGQRAEQLTGQPVRERDQHPTIDPNHGSSPDDRLRHYPNSHFRAPQENKSPYLDYATALRRGRPIATRVIEGGCRHLTKDRFSLAA